MRQKANERKETSGLQNQFTAYLVTAVQRRKVEYIRKQERVRHYEISVDLQENPSLRTVEPDMLEDLPLEMQIEDMTILRILGQLSERDRHILFAKILNGRSLCEIADELHLRYPSVASAYERAIRKLKKGKGDMS